MTIVAPTAAAAVLSTFASVTTAPPFLAARSDAATTAALTTTFVPPVPCDHGYLTILEDQGYELWLNEPVPVPQLTIGTCYPSAWINGYSSPASSSSSIAPLLSPLVCPHSWRTASSWDGGYIACCPSKYTLHPPDTTVDASRPAYGGTCYSPFTLSQTVNATLYNATELSYTTPWVASTNGAQAFAHVIDGYGVAAATTTGSDSAGTDTSTGAITTVTSSSSANNLSGGSIAGIVVGVLAGVALLGALGFFLLRRRNAASTANEPRTGSSPGDSAAPVYEKSGDEHGFYGGELDSAASPSSEHAWSPARSATLSHGSTSQHHYNGPSELDNGPAAAEIYGREIPRPTEKADFGDEGRLNSPESAVASSRSWNH